MKRPNIPPGARAFVAMSADGRQWTVRLQLPGDEPTWRCKRLSPVFSGFMTAVAWRDAYEAFAAGETERFEFEYPAGAA